MPLRSDWSSSPCPMARTLDVVGDPWVMLILREAFTGARRYEQFKRRLSAADNVLSRRLAAMVEAGLLRRSPYQGEQRTHDEYVLTEAGADLLPVLHALGNWGAKHTTAPANGGAIDVIHTACGERTRSADVCTACGERLHAEEVAWSRVWLGDRRELTGAA